MNQFDKEWIRMTKLCKRIDKKCEDCNPKFCSYIYKNNGRFIDKPSWNSFPLIPLKKLTPEVKFNLEKLYLKFLIEKGE